jgi:cytochrome c oxidase subunit 2
MAQPVVAAVMFAATGLTPVEAESPNAERIADLYWFVSFWAALVLLAVAVPLAIFIIRYRSRGRDRTVEGPQIHGSTKLEIAWTLVPVVILLFVVAFTFYKLPGITLEDEAQAGDLRIRVEGRQFYWQYRYPNGVIAIDRLVAPEDRLVLLEITAPENDVIHSYWVPGIGGKFDAIPGRTAQTGFQADEVGLYEGQCAEFCGIQHAEMLAEIEVRRAEEFDSWLEEQAQAQRAGSSDLGEQTFAGACAKCHGPEGQGLIGPEFTSANTADAEAVARVVRNGRGRMPPIGEEWEDFHMEALTDYLTDRFGGEEEER